MNKIPHNRGNIQDLEVLIQDQPQCDVGERLERFDPASDTILALR